MSEKIFLKLGETMYLPLDNLTEEQILLIHDVIKSTSSIKKSNEEKEIVNKQSEYYSNISKAFVDIEDNDFLFHSKMRCAFCIKTMANKNSKDNKKMDITLKPCSKWIFRKYMNHDREMTKEEDELLMKKLRENCQENINRVLWEILRKHLRGGDDGS